MQAFDHDTSVGGGSAELAITAATLFRRIVGHDGEIVALQLPVDRRGVPTDRLGDASYRIAGVAEKGRDTAFVERDARERAEHVMSTTSSLSQEN